MYSKIRCQKPSKEEQVQKCVLKKRGIERFKYVGK